MILKLFRGNRTQARDDDPWDELDFVPPAEVDAPAVAVVPAEIMVRRFEDAHFLGAKDARQGAGFELCLASAANFADTLAAQLAFAAGWTDGYRGQAAEDPAHLFGNGAGKADQRPLVQGPSIGPVQLMTAFRDGYLKGRRGRPDFRACLKPGTYNTVQEGMAYAAGWIDGVRGRNLTAASFSMFGDGNVPKELLQPPSNQG